MFLLIDMDAFFASVEQLHHPHLRGKPVIVCGDPSRRGVVTAASYEARPFGVRAGMPLGEARRLCPQAEYVEGSPDKYVSISLKLLELYLTFTPDVEPFSVDEAFVALDPRLDLDGAAAVARDIQKAIDQRFGLGASIGVGPNKLVAKMASGLDKPRGLSALDEAGFQRAFWPEDVQSLWGVGPRLAERMRSLGIKTVGDLAHAPEHLLKATFGIIGPQLKEAAHGRDDTPLVPYHQGADAKSMGHEVTLASDSADPAFLEGLLLRLADQVARRLRGDGVVGRIVTLKLRDQHFVTRTRQRALTGHTADHRLIFEIARALFRSNWKGGPLRLLGLSVSDLEHAYRAAQAEMFEPDRRSARLTEAMDRVRDKLGEASLVPAGSLTRSRAPSHVPFGAATAEARRALERSREQKPAARPPATRRPPGKSP